MALCEGVQEEGPLNCNGGKQRNLISRSAQSNLILVCPFIYMLELLPKRPPLSP